jgi:hypothetical protein
MTIPTTTTTNVKAFLRALTRLSRKHGIIIAGCGCEGSPYLDFTPRDLSEGGYVVEEVKGKFADNLYWYVPRKERHDNP